MNKKTKTTLKHVAELAGVSTATASMILSRREGVSFSPDTVAKVQLAAETLGYGRQSLPPPGIFRKKVVAVFLPDIAGNYYTTMTKAVNYAASLKGFDTICIETYRNREREIRGLSYIEASDVAGIVFTYVPHNIEFVEQTAKRLPVVVIGNLGSDVRLDSVETDNYRAGVLLARHLLGLGHRHVAFLSTALEWWGYASTQRIAGVRDAFWKAGSSVRLTERMRPIKTTLHEDGKEVNRAIGRALCESCLEDRSITAFLALNDYVAYGVMDALEAHHFRIPEDYSVCGSDDLYSSSLPGVRLTTINHHVSEKGIKAFELLLKRMMEREAGEQPGDTPVSAIKVECESTLIVRGSTGPPKPSA